MKVKLILLDGEKLKNNYTIPYIFEGKGRYGLELVICKVVEIYYGSKARMLLEDTLKIRLTDEEINNNFQMELKK